MKATEFKVPIPEGIEIDKKNSTFECIKFKPIKPKKWRDDKNASFSGYFIAEHADILKMEGAFNVSHNYNVFATKKQAKAARAMARISQIMANDERFGGVVTDEEWNTDSDKYTIERVCESILRDQCNGAYYFLAFHTAKQRDLFLKENEDLIKDYLMID